MGLNGCCRITTKVVEQQDNQKAVPRERSSKENSYNFYCEYNFYCGRISALAGFHFELDFNFCNLLLRACCEIPRITAAAD